MPYLHRLLSDFCGNYYTVLFIYLPEPKAYHYSLLLDDAWLLQSKDFFEGQRQKTVTVMVIRENRNYGL